MTWFFGYFACDISFNVYEIADTMKKNKHTIKGVKPGSQTVEYLKKQRNSMIAINCFALVFIAMLPAQLSNVFHMPYFTFLGTSLVIVVSMLLDMGDRIKAMRIHRKNALFQGVEL